MGSFINWIKQTRETLLSKEIRVFSPGGTSSTPTERLPFRENIPWIDNAPFGIPRKVNVPEIRSYAKSAWVQMVLNTISKQIMVTEWDVVVDDNVDDNQDYSEQIKKVKGLLKYPNRNKETFWDLWIPFIRDVLEMDSGVIFKGRNGSGELVELFAYDGTRFLIKTDRHGIIENYYQYSFITPQSAPIKFLPDEIIYGKINSNSETYPYGWSPLMSITQEVEVMIQSTRYNKEFFRNNAIPSGIVKIKMIKDQLAQFIEGWKNQLTGKAHKLAFVNADEMDFVNLSTNNRDMEWLEGQKWYFHLVFGAYGVSPQEAGFYENSNKSTGESQERITVKNAIQPYLSLIESKINREIIPEILKLEDGDELPIKFKWILRDNAAEKIEHQQRMEKLQAGVITINEIRGEEGLDDVEWGDKPLNLFLQDNFKENDSDFNRDSRENSKDRDSKKEERNKEVVQEEIELKKKNRVIAIGPRGGRIVGYDSHHNPIYEGSPEDKKRERQRLDNRETDKQEEPFIQEAELIKAKLKEKNIDIFGDINLGGVLKDARESSGIDFNRWYNNGGKIVYTAYKDEILERARKFDPFNNQDRHFAYLLSFIGSYGIRDSPEFVDKIIEELREKTDNDTKQMNYVLKYMHVKKRVTKEGIKANTSNQTREEVNSGLIEDTVNGQKIKYSQAFFRSNKHIKNEKELKALMSSAMDKFTGKAKDLIKKDNTTIHFITRVEARRIVGRASNDTLGYYLPNTKQVYIFSHRQDTSRGFNVDEDLLKRAGYDQEFIDKVQKVSGKNSVEHTIIHELGHAVALNDDSKVQNKFNEVVKRAINNDSSSEEGKVHITSYGATNMKEDFAETFAFYLKHKEAVKSLLDKPNIVPELLKVKLRYMRDEI